MSKLKAKEIRERQKMEKRQQYQQKESERIEKKEEQQKLKNNTNPENEKFTPYPKNDKPKRKSLAKANGLKSSFVVGDYVYLTSGGKGNSAIIEKSIENDIIISKNTPSKFNANYMGEGKKQLKIESNRVNQSGISDFPQIGQARQDLLGLKDLLEKKYFGKTFNDNIHIQIIYNIMDIRKILAIHSNNTVVSLDNLFRSDNPEYKTDFIGSLSTRYDFDTFKTSSIRVIMDQFNSIINSPYIGYFGDILKTSPQKEETIKKAYDILALLGSIRQDCTHISVEISNHQTTDSWLYNLDDPQYLAQEFRDVLDKVYRKKFDSLAQDFISTSGVNIKVAQNAVEAVFGKSEFSEMENLIKEYYDFTERKLHKNLGFSIKHLREKILDSKECEKIKSTKYDSVRSKLYKAIDFVIYYYYAFICPDRIDKNVDVLRATTDEMQKDTFYINESKYIFRIIGQNNIEKIAYDVSKLPKDKDSNKRFFEQYKNIHLDDFTNADYFSKLIFLLTHFIDGKEINDLLTTLINKFDNIDSLLDVAKRLDVAKKPGLKTEPVFVPEYHLFESSKKIRDELRVINNVARMTKPDKTAKKAMYRDALEILGIPDRMTEEDIDRVLNDILGYDENGKATKKKGQHGFRNFIASNVIESSRFHYLIRYANAKKVKSIASNRNVVRFALSNIPESQIDRYYKICGGKRDIDLQEKIDWLANIITNINYSDFEKVNNAAGKNNYGYDDKMEKQAIISLYLTVLYHVEKNLVYVNSRYLIAFYCGERDAKLLGSNSFDENYDTDYCSLTKMYLENNYKNKHAKQYLTQNMSNLNDSTPFDNSKEFIEGNMIIRYYRNNVAHLSVARNADIHIGKISEFHSYFELYHFIMQSLLKSGIFKGEREDSENTVSITINSYFDNLEKYKTYSKDLVKALNAPFGYNLARYKNLSIEPLFDKNNTRIDEAKKELN